MAETYGGLRIGMGIGWDDLQRALDNQPVIVEASDIDRYTELAEQADVVRMTLTAGDIGEMGAADEEKRLRQIIRDEVDRSEWRPVGDLTQVPRNTPLLVAGPGFLGKPEMAVVELFDESWGPQWYPIGVSGYEYDIDIKPRFWRHTPSMPRC